MSITFSGENCRPRRSPNIESECISESRDGGRFLPPLRVINRQTEDCATTGHRWLSVVARSGKCSQIATESFRVATGKEVLDLFVNAAPYWSRESKQAATFVRELQNAAAPIV